LSDKGKPLSFLGKGKKLTSDKEHISDDQKMVAVSKGKVWQDDSELKNKKSNDLHVDRIFATIANDLEEKTKTKQKLKENFYRRIMGLFQGAVIASVVVIFLAIIYKPGEGIAITAIFAGFAEIIASLIVVPKIIAKHLFGEKEDEHQTKLIKALLIHNRELNPKSLGQAGVAGEDAEDLRGVI